MDPVGHKRIIIRLFGFMSLIDGSQLVPQFHPVATQHSPYILVAKSTIDRLISHSWFYSSII